MHRLNYTRVGLHRQDTESQWKNFCDLHLYHTQSITGHSASLIGPDAVSADEVAKTLGPARPFTSEYFEPQVLRDITQAGRGQMRTSNPKSLWKWECELFGPILYEGKPYRRIVVGMAGNFKQKGLQMGTLYGLTDEAEGKPVPLLPFGRLKWSVELWNQRTVMYAFLMTSGGSVPVGHVVEGAEALSTPSLH